VREKKERGNLAKRKRRGETSQSEKGEKSAGADTGIKGLDGASSETGLGCRRRSTLGGLDGGNQQGE